MKNWKTAVTKIKEDPIMELEVMMMVTSARDQQITTAIAHPMER